MGRINALLLAGAAAILSGSAYAADLPPPPLAEPAPYAAPPVLEFSGWYLRGDVGIGVSDSLKLKTLPDPLLSAGPGATYQLFNQKVSAFGTFDLGIGYQFNNWLRFDLTGGYHGVGGQLTAVDQLNTGILPGGPGASLRNFYSGHLSSLVVLANGYVDLGSWNGITPFLGAGVGLSRNTFSGLTDQGFNYITAPGGAISGFPTGGFAPSHSNTSLAWALMAGLDYSVSNNLKLELGYRYLNLGKFKSGALQCFNAGGGIGCPAFNLETQRLGSHEVRLGMRWLLNDAAPAPAPVHYEPPPAPAPIIRKF